MPPLEETAAFVLKSTRFGHLRLPMDRIVDFEEGMVGYSSFRHYVLVEHPSGGPFLWLQSMENPSLAFPVVDPRQFCPDFKLVCDKGELSSLALSDVSDAQVLTVVTVPAGKTGELWLNLQGPVVINTHNQRGRQLVLTGESYPLRFRVVLEGPSGVTA